MSDEYVRKDYYDANMAEIRALMTASEERHNRISAEIRAEALASESRNKEQIAKIEAQTAKIEAQTASILRSQDTMLNRVSLIVGIATLAYAIIPVIVSVVISLLRK